MEVKSLLEFLNKTKNMYAPEYAVCDSVLVNFLEIISVEKDFVENIDLGLVYVHKPNSEQTIIVDGLNRILSLSLLLHAICECYKKTTDQNTKAIQTIRGKYLLNNTRTKLRLSKNLQNIYDKIIFGERMSGNEKKHPMFILLHSYWQFIKDNKLKAVDIFSMLQKIHVITVDVDNVNPRDLYYSLNCKTKNLNQILLIDDYLNTTNTKEVWKEIKELYQNRNTDLILFFKDFFRNKFNFKKFDESKLYEYFVNYFETMLKYMKSDKVIEKIKHSAKLYMQLLNIDMPNKELKDAMIQLKLHNCEDTFAYLLSVYEDYTDGSLSLATFLEILSAVREYLEKREQTQNNVGFNELIQYLNAFIAYK